MTEWNEIEQFMEEHGLQKMHEYEPNGIEAAWEPEEELTGIRKLKGTLAWKLLKPARVVYNVSCLVLRYAKSHGVKATAKRIRQKQLSPRYIRSILPSEEEKRRQSKTVFERKVTFSILVPLYNTPSEYLKQMIQSVQDQTYSNWELCLADGSDAAHGSVGELCRTMQKEDPRIRYEKLEKNLGISENTNHCIHMAKGDYICLFDHDDVLHPSALYEVMKAICEKDADFIYTDEATFLKDDLENIVTYHFKPDYAIDNLLANNYICHFTSFKKDLIKQAGEFRHAYDGSQDHDMILRLTDAAQHVVHIPKLLYFWRSHPDSVAQNINSKSYAVEAGKNVVRDFLASKGVEAEVESSWACPTIYRIKYQLAGTPKVSIVIPNKDHTRDLALCIDSIRKRTTYSDYEIIIVENNSETEEIREYYGLLEKIPNISVVEWKEKFNYSAINNFGVSYATGEYVILLNNDIEIITPDWIQEMLMFAQRQDVGAVGVKLYYENFTIQHAGVILKVGEHGVAGHSHVGEQRASVGYIGRLCYAQDVSAVTAACLMVAKEKYSQVKGLDEGLAVAYNDVDFCLKLREKGYLNVFTPTVEAVHYESRTRGYDDNEGSRQRLEAEAGYMRKKWKDVLDAGDPFYNPNMSLKNPWHVSALEEHE